MGYRRAAGAAGAVAVGVAALAGCGGDGWRGSPGGVLAGMDAEEVAYAALEALAGADAVRIAFESSDEELTMRGDVRIASDGDCSAVVTTDEYGDFEMLQQGDDLWFGGEAWLAATGAGGEVDEEMLDAASDILQGRYLHVDLASEDAADMAEMAGWCSLEEMAPDPAEAAEEGEEVTFGEADLLGGEPTVTVNATGPDDQTSTMRVAAAGVPYPLEISGHVDGGVHSMEMTYGEPPDVRAPDADRTMEIAAFQRELMERALDGAFDEPLEG
jgi:hypothetical protein